MRNAHHCYGFGLQYPLKRPKEFITMVTVKTLTWFIEDHQWRTFYQSPSEEDLPLQTGRKREIRSLAEMHQLQTREPVSGNGPPTPAEFPRRPNDVLES
jgi:hypothetical protein